MNTYKVWLQGKPLMSIQAENPQEAIKTALGTKDLSIVPLKEEYSQSNARVSLVKNGIVMNVNHYNVQLNLNQQRQRQTVFVVTFCREPYSDDVAGGVEIAGVFSTSDKAQTAKNVVKQWLKKEGYTEGEVFCLPTAINHLTCYEIDKML